MTKSQINKLQKKLEKAQNTVGLDRDALDEIISEAEGLRESCDRAWDHLQDARDALSELV